MRVTASDVHNKQPKQQLQQQQQAVIEKRAKKIFAEDFELEAKFRWLPSSWLRPVYCQQSGWLALARVDLTGSEAVCV